MNIKAHYYYLYYIAIIFVVVVGLINPNTIPPILLGGHVFWGGYLLIFLLFTYGTICYYAYRIDKKSYPDDNFQNKNWEQIKDENITALEEAKRISR